VVAFIALAVSVFTLVPLQAQDRVLQLNGNGDYVELPAGAFTNLESATIEAWVNWGSFQSMSRVFALTLKGGLINLQNRATGPDLWVEYLPRGGGIAGRCNSPAS